MKRRVMVFAVSLLAATAIAGTAWACRHCRTVTPACPAPCAEIVRDYVFPCCPSKACCEKRPCRETKTYCPKPCCQKQPCREAKSCCKQRCVNRCGCGVYRTKVSCGCDACADSQPTVAPARASVSPSDTRPAKAAPTLAPIPAAPKPAAAAKPVTKPAAAAPVPTPPAPKPAAAEKPAETPAAKPAAPPAPPAPPTPAKTTSSDRSFRTWIDSTGQHRVTARFVSLMDGGIVRLQKVDGAYVRIAMDRLSQTDRGYVTLETSAVASR